MKELFITFIIIMISLLTIIGIIAYTNTKNLQTIEVCDTLYNKVTLDSIEYNIIKRDTIIYNIKTEMKDEIKQSKVINDSDAVKLFNKLVAE